MKFSIVTISFNQAKYLRECIESVISQENVDVEYIIVDPGSTDGSRDIIMEYFNKGKCKIIFKSDFGPADGLNNGFACATGDVFGFLNSDDILYPGALELIKNEFIKNKYINMVSGCGYFIDEFGNKIKSIVPTIMSPFMYLYGGVSVFQQGTFFNKDLYNKSGGFNVKNKTCWDGELFFKMACLGLNQTVIGSDLAAFRLHGDSITGSGRLNDKYLNDCDRIFKEYYCRDKYFFDKLVAYLITPIKIVKNKKYIFRKTKKWIKN